MAGTSTSAAEIEDLGEGIGGSATHIERTITTAQYLEEAGAENTSVSRGIRSVMQDEKELEKIEIQLLLEGVFHHYGWDFRDYAPASLKRRIRECVRAENLDTVSGLQERVLHDPACMKRLVDAISIDVTSMFRDPGFYVALREIAVPLLRRNPLIRIWHAGCATGEEVYSTAILLHEEGFDDRVRTFATDINESSLQKAKEGILPLKVMPEYTDNYLRAGGTRSFSEYYTARYEHAILRPWLRKGIVWALHNLVTDASFNEFHVILCRNVMIYFNRSLQDRVHRLIYGSLAMGGVLGLGSKESLRFTVHEADYEVLDARQKLYCKRR